MNPELYQQEGYDFMAAAFAVYNEMGSGFLEEIYHESLELEFTGRGISFISKPRLAIFYKGHQLKKTIRGRPYRRRRNRR